MTLTTPATTDLVSQLTLEQKVSLLTGRDFWSTVELPEIGLRSMVLSDGPSGVRGALWDERDPSLNLPSSTCLSASWDVGLAVQYGRHAAAEARRKGVDVVLGPTINIQRSPLGGRHFEAFSEDPVLTAELAASYVSGMQELGVAATPKHFIANDFETDRFTVDVRVGDRALREVYLLAFEKAVREAGAWAVMSAYNSINGTTATENVLLDDPLEREWGFDGVVVSDWTAVRALESARHRQDLVMPGPEGPWGDALRDAVLAGEIAERLIDEKVARILDLARRVGALPPYTKPEHAAEDGVAFAREAAGRGMVLVQNDGILPLGTPVRIAVIGDNARAARTQGGGSATVVPSRVVSPLDGVREAFPDATVHYSLGALVQEGIRPMPLRELGVPGDERRGILVDYFDGDGTLLLTEERFATDLTWMGGDVPVELVERIRIRSTWTPVDSETVLFGFAGVGRCHVLVDGELLLDDITHDDSQLLGAALMHPPESTAALTLIGGQSYDLSIDYEPQKIEGFPGVMNFTFGAVPLVESPSALIAEAAAAAAAADVVVLVVGTNALVESEGFDRSDLRLPGEQDELAEAVLAANPKSVVIVNSGAPVELPWRERAAAVLLGWFGGQEFGHAIGDVLSGAVEPGGRLPTTWPVRLEDAPVSDVTPVGGVVAYDEGIHLGYRAWLRADTAPAYAFGFGLGYTEWSLSDFRAPSSVRAGDDAIVTVDLANTGQRAGRQVVQAYLSAPESQIDRPVRWLAAFAAEQLQPGEVRTVSLRIPARAFAHWNDGWEWERGGFDVRCGFSVVDDAVGGHLVITGE